MNFRFWWFVCLFVFVCGQVRVNWVKCPEIHYQNIKNQLYRSKLDCSFTSVPSNWENPNGKNFTFFLRRLKAEKNRKGQFWINDGGPGGSADWNRFGEASLLMYEKFNREMDIIIPSHRGTGYSSPLGCPQEKDPKWKDEMENPGTLLQECKNYVSNKYGKLLEFYNPTQAARDIYNVAESLRINANEKIAIFGVSYGAFLMNRYMTIYPDSNHLIILDGIASPQILEFVKYDVNANRVGGFQMKLCTHDSFCSSKLKNPIEELKEIFKQFNNQNSCSEFFNNISKERFKLVLFQFISAQPGGWMFLIPPLILRIKRCNSFDKIIIKQFLKATDKLQKLNHEYLPYSQLTEIQIGLSEFLYNSTLPPLKEVKRNEEELLFSTRLSIRYRVLKDVWFSTKTDEFYQKFANTKQPFLLLHGVLDPQTPYSHAPYYFRKVKKSPFQYFVTFPTFVHVVLRHFEGNCSQRIMVDFVRDPKTQPDLSCVKKLSKIDWKGERKETKEISKRIFSIDDLWAGL